MRQEEPPRALGADSFVDRRALVGAEIVHDDDVATLQGRRKNLLDIGQKAFAVDRPIEYEGRRDFVTSQGGEECHRFPMTLRRLGDEHLAASVPAMCARHIGLRPCLIDEDEAPWIEPQLDFLPQGAAPRDVGAILLAGEKRFF